ncbi:MAG TPA: hypothetical protein VHW46_11430 [Terracidiphilus sp.]|jgi:hypothetical protein|nr:hypothetical protein [Terracidiphilus sp.]
MGQRTENALKTDKQIAGIVALKEGWQSALIERRGGIRRVLITGGTTTLEDPARVAILQELRDAETT